LVKDCEFMRLGKQRSVNFFGRQSLAKFYDFFAWLALRQ